MRAARDTFLRFLGDNLGSVAIHALRRDSNNPNASNLQMNAVNVHFLDSFVDSVSYDTAVVDVIFDDENAGVDAIKSVTDILRASYFTPLLDYTVPASPVPIGGTVSWARKDLKFKSIYNESYCHYSCTLQIQFYSL
jgi:hypothetical protein